MTALAFDATLEPADAIAHRRRLLWAMPTGLYVLGSTVGEEGPYNLMTCNLAVQVATSPCVTAAMRATGVATLCVLRRDQRALVRRFVKPVEDVELDADGRVVALGGAAVALAPSGAPYLTDAAGCLDLRVVATQPFESHTLFCGEVTAAAVAAEVLEGPASARVAEILRMEDTKMSYGG